MEPLGKSLKPIATPLTHGLLLVGKMQSSQVVLWDLRGQGLGLRV